MRYLLSGNPADVERVLREFGRLVRRGVITVTPLPDAEETPATDTKEAHVTDTKAAPPADTKTTKRTKSAK